MGCAPSHELLQKWNKGERELIATNPNRVPPLATLPNATNALLRSLAEAKAEKVAQEAAQQPRPVSTAATVI
jgi:formamidase